MPPELLSLIQSLPPGVIVVAFALIVSALNELTLTFVCHLHTKLLMILP